MVRLLVTLCVYTSHFCVVLRAALVIYVCVNSLRSVLTRKNGLPQKICLQRFCGKRRRNGARLPFGVLHKRR